VASNFATRHPTAARRLAQPEEKDMTGCFYIGSEGYPERAGEGKGQAPEPEGHGIIFRSRRAARRSRPWINGTKAVEYTNAKFADGRAHRLQSTRD